MKKRAYQIVKGIFIMISTTIMLWSAVVINVFASSDAYISMPYSYNGQELRYNEETNDVCIQNNDEINCFLECSYSEELPRESFYFNDDKIICINDGFDLNYYDLVTQNKIIISNDIQKYLQNLGRDDSPAPFGTLIFLPFSLDEDNWNSEKTRFYVEVNTDSYEKAICVIDLEKIDSKEDYLECPMAYSFNIRDDAEETTFVQNPPFADKWIDSESLSIIATKEDVNDIDSADGIDTFGEEYVLHTDINELEKSGRIIENINYSTPNANEFTDRQDAESGYYNYCVTSGVIIFIIVCIGVVIFRMRKK